jgi:hypothetical protein
MWILYSDYISSCNDVHLEGGEQHSVVEGLQFAVLGAQNQGGRMSNRLVFHL